MDVLQPTSLAGALEAKAERPEAVPLAGGTDLMVEINFDRSRPEAILDLTRVPELKEWSGANGTIRLGAGVTYTQLIADLAAELPGLAIASRTVGSPQIRNRGTIGGNLGTSSPAGDTLPVLVATRAEVEVSSSRGVRRMPVTDFITGVKENVLALDELITTVLLARAKGPQQFSKIGPRNAMVIAVASWAVAIDADARTVGTGIGSAGPRPLVAAEAERFIAGVLEESDLWEKRAALNESALARFAALAGEAAAPIDDVRGTARYRRHAVSVIARRTLTWAWDEFRGRK